MIFILTLYIVIASIQDRKQKALEELLTNPNTIKLRKQIKQIDKIEAIIKTAKHNDVSVQTYAVNKKLRLNFNHFLKIYF